MKIDFPVKNDVTGEFDLVPVTISAEEGGKLAVSFPFCRALSDRFKTFEGADWQGHRKPPRKVWLIANTPGNQFRMDAMRWLGRDPKTNKPILGGHDPYERYKDPLIKVECGERRFQGQLTKYYAHQAEGVSFIVTRRQCVLAWDMGTGKTLVAGTAMEWAFRNYNWDHDDFWFVCKKGALYQVMLDFVDWEIAVRPRFMSYDEMKRLVDQWPNGKPAPKFVVFDESTQIKSPTSQRTEAAQWLANSMRKEWGDDAFVVLMTGTPSPKNPCDWHPQAETACPGFIREGEYNKFKAGLAVIVQQANKHTGGVYNDIKKDADGNKIWWDDENRCANCGEFEKHVSHVMGACSYRKSVNQVLRVDARLRGLVSKKKKAECLDLPKRVYRLMRCRPNLQTLNAAKLISKTARGAADALTRLRELSDGFQYADQVVDKVKCSMCGGSGLMVARMDPENPGLPLSQEALANPTKLVDYEKECDQCNGAGECDIKKREAMRAKCPKDDVVEDVLDEFEDVGRVPIYCGFTGSVDRVVDICLRKKWYVIRVDGRGWIGFTPEGMPPLPGDGRALYSLYRSDFKGKVAVVAQASTAAHGLNFDNSPVIVNYSRDFNFENALQGDERNMRGKIKETLEKHKRSECVVVEIIHLPSDEFILENHKRKRRLQALTLGEVQLAAEMQPRDISSHGLKTTEFSE